MKLYHYTSVKSFKKIWESKSLRFSDSKRTNDIFEKRKLVQVDNVTFPAEYKPNSRESFFKHFFEILATYRQISLCMDYDDAIKGYASPMMWGQYANSCKGVCIELDSDKLLLSNENVWADRVEYTDTIPEIVFKDCVFMTDDDIYTFIDGKIDDIFFKKHFHWKYENEYRIISNNEDFLLIRDAITAVYVPDMKGYAFREVDKLIKGSNIKFSYLFPITSKGGRKISCINVETIRRCKRQLDEGNKFSAKEILIRKV